MKRKLTNTEIEDILSQLKNYNNLPKEINNSSMNKIKSELKNKLLNIEIYPDVYNELKNIICREYHKSMVSPGESVGVIVGQSLGEKQTQSTLNSFHSSGMTIKTVVTGVPRFSELMAATKDPKGVISEVYFKEKLNNPLEVKQYIGNSIISVYMKDIIDTFEFIANPSCKRWYVLFSKIHNERINLTNMVRIKLKRSILYTNKIDLKQIKKEIELKYNDLQVVYAPLNLLYIDVFIKNDKLDIPELKVQYVDEDNKWDVYVEDVLIPNLNKILVCGIEGIKDYIISKNGDEYYLETEGTNLNKLSLNKKVDFTRTMSNNMWNIYECFGVEATRQFLINEFSKVLNSDGTFINYRHIKLLVDTMTFGGSIISISRYGTRDKASPMARASFEESLDNFLKAGVYGELETTKSISSSIMLGKNSRIGTGFCDVMYDISSIEEEPEYMEF